MVDSSVHNLRQIHEFRTFKKYQMEDVIKWYKNGKRGALFWDVGLGKTYVASHIIKYELRTNSVNKIMVVVPAALQILWQEELDNLNIEYTIVKIKTKSLTRVNIISYESIFRREKLLDKFKKDIDFWVLDESHKIKSIDAKSTKTISEYVNDSASLLLMSGTPAPNDPIEYYTQIRLINKDALPELEMFYIVYGYPIEFEVAARNGRKFKMKKYVLDKKKLSEYLKIVYKYASFRKTEDELDLPDLSSLVYHYKLTTEQRNLMSTAISNDSFTIDDKEISTNGFSQLINKTKQMLSGFVYDDDKKTHEIPTNKLKLLKELIDDTSGQVIVYALYHHEYKVLSKLKECRVINNLTKEKEKAQILKDFRNGKFKILVAHPASIGIGYTLTNAKTIIWYSLTFSLVDYLQGNGRIYRVGQKSNVRIIHLVCNTDIKVGNITFNLEKTIMESLTNKKEVKDAVFTRYGNLKKFVNS